MAVEFCTGCGTSLPKGDLTIKGGKMYTSHDYTCPSCNQIANPAPATPEEEISTEKDIVFRQGQKEIQ